MKIAKECPQCGREFMARSNQRYCSGRCKVAAFREGKTQLFDVDKVTHTETGLLDHSTPYYPPSRQAPQRLLSTSPQPDPSELSMRRLEGQASGLKPGVAAQLDAEQLFVQRQAEQQNQSLQLQALTKQVAQLQLRMRPPLVEWGQFPVGIRRRYQALVEAVLKITESEVPMDRGECQAWLDEYVPFQGVVQDLIAYNDALKQANTPFIWLAELARLVETHQDVKYWSNDEQDLVFVLPQDLRQRLIQACL